MAPLVHSSQILNQKPSGWLYVYLVQVMHYQELVEVLTSVEAALHYSSNNDVKRVATAIHLKQVGPIDNLQVH